RPPFRRLAVAKVGRPDNESDDVLLDGRAFLSRARRRLNRRRSDNSYGWAGGSKKRLKWLGLPAARVCGGSRWSRFLSESWGRSEQQERRRDREHGYRQLHLGPHHCGC